MPATQPTLFIPHGAGPCFFMEQPPGPPGTWNEMAGFLTRLRQLVPEPPIAVLVVSSHWKTEVPTVMTTATPPLGTDELGPRVLTPEVRELTWAAPGSPETAHRVAELLRAAGIDCVEDDGRGFDHGVWVPLKLAFPDADIPTFQLSLQADLDAERHLAIGRALRPLRDAGVLIVGSGFSFHNLRLVGSAEGTEASRGFDTWLERVVCRADTRDRDLASWRSAPGGLQSHGDNPDHLVPLLVAAGAAAEDPGEVVYREDLAIGIRVSAHRFAQRAAT